MGIKVCGVLPVSFARARNRALINRRRRRAAGDSNLRRGFGGLLPALIVFLKQLRKPDGVNRFEEIGGREVLQSVHRAASSVPAVWLSFRFGQDREVEEGAELPSFLP
jgi:hypothetical protein